MPGKVTLIVTAGPIQGTRFDFTQHDTLLFGRAPDCHARLAASDTSASRHHFLLEANPPAVRLRDLGSLNGTHVNGERHGGRARHETPEEGGRRAHAEVDLRDGDRIRVGATIFTVGIEAPAACCDCGRPIEEGERAAAAWIAGTFLCIDCRRRTGTGGRTDAPVRPSPGSCGSRPAATTDGRAGSIGDYEVGPLLGKGGMGAVYRARRRTDGREIALKLLLPKVAVSAETRANLLREIEVTLRLRHPNIVEMVGCGVDGDGFYFAMEYCPGGSIEARVGTEGALPLGVAAPLALQALEGLAFAHGAGFVHRDVKPDNILIAADGSAKLTDFGLAKSFEQAGVSGLTATGAVAGTLSFMPREQITSFRQLRPASDVWSMGATIYYMLTKEYTRDFRGKKDPHRGDPERPHRPAARARAPRATGRLRGDRSRDRRRSQGTVSHRRRAPGRPARGARLMAAGMTIVCPSCGARSDGAPAHLVGRSVRCPRCSSRFKVEAPGPGPTVPESAEPVPTSFEGEAAVPGSTTSASGRFTRERLTEWQLGDVLLDLYEVLGLLGEGGMGRVYRVRHRGWDMDLAAKVPRLAVLDLDGGADLFEREAETWVNLGLHPHTVTCFYVRRLQGVPVVFAEFVDGGSMHDRIRSRKLSRLDDMLDVAIQVAWGLHYAHEQGLVHLDVKPANVMITNDGLAKVTDFGLARARRRPRISRAGPILPARDGDTLNVDGAGGGTPAYMSPEQAGGHALTRRSDLWSWALSILEMFAGHRTWEWGVTGPDALEEHLVSQAPPGVAEMPDRVIDLLRRCFREDPEERPHTLLDAAGTMRDAYEAATGRLYPRREPRTGQRTPDGLNNRAVSLLDLGRDTEAAALWKAALEAEPQHVEATYNESLTGWTTGRIDDEEMLRRMGEARATHAGVPGSTTWRAGCTWRSAIRSAPSPASKRRCASVSPRPTWTATSGWPSWWRPPAATRRAPRSSSSGCWGRARPKPWTSSATCWP